MVDAIEIIGQLLLFALVFGMSATVEIKSLKKQLQNRNAILTGIFLQFVLLPFLGFAVVNALDMHEGMGVTLLVVTSSPGGSYSNWWCSMFNADLALSVTMTAISTMMSVIMLPLNLLVYAKFSYNDDVIASLDWLALFIALVIVISAIALGLFASAKQNSPAFNLFANKLGNFAGIALVVFSATLANTGGGDTQLWERDWKFFVGVAAPCVLGLFFANIITTALTLKKPERVTVSVECCYQNVGIATSVAITMFDGDELSEAIGVPFFYGVVEAVILGLYCIGAWKMGWTKAPANAPIWKVIATSYEVVGDHEEEKIEVTVRESEDDLRETSNDDGSVVHHYVEMGEGSKKGSKKETTGETTSSTAGDGLLKGSKEEETGETTSSTAGLLKADV